MALVGVLLGCNIVQGFEDAGDALFPNEKTHLDSPGLQLVSGGYRGLDIAAAIDLYLLARSSDPEDTSLYAMQFADPKPCSIPNVARYVDGRGAFRSRILIAFFEEAVQQGTLHFADSSCKISDFSLENAFLPVDEIDRGLVIRVGEALELVDPVKRTREVLALSVDNINLYSTTEGHLVWGGGRIGIFRTDWTELGWFGEGVLGVGALGRSLFFEDAGGIHRLTAAPSGRIDEEVIAPDGCALGSAGPSWASYASPCGEARPVVYDERTGKSTALDVDADPRLLRIYRARDAVGNDPAVDPYWFAWLRAIDYATITGTLVVRTPSGTELEIGEHAALDRFDLDDTDPTQVHGHALVDLEADLGRYLFFTPDGSVRELATGVLRRSEGLVIDYDGVAGNLALARRDQLLVVAEGVPWRGYQNADPQGRWTAIFHDFDGVHGNLSVMDGRLDPARVGSKSNPVKLPLRPIASQVRYFGSTFLYDVLPGVGYLADHDTETDTGRLEYNNFELDFRALVSEGVSDFIVTSDGVLYAVPFGDNRGIWLVRSK